MNAKFKQQEPEDDFEMDDVDENADAFDDDENGSHHENQSYKNDPRNMLKASYVSDRHSKMFSKDQEIEEDDEYISEESIATNAPYKDQQQRTNKFEGTNNEEEDDVEPEEDNQEYEDDQSQSPQHQEQSPQMGSNQKKLPANNFRDATSLDMIETLRKQGKTHEQIMNYLITNSIHAQKSSSVGASRKTRAKTATNKKGMPYGFNKSYKETKTERKDSSASQIREGLEFAKAGQNLSKKGNEQKQEGENPTEFRSAYTDLAEKVFSEVKEGKHVSEAYKSLIDPDRVNKLVEKRSIANKQAQSELTDRLQYHTVKITEKKKHKEIEAEEKKMEECTFMPRTLQAEKEGEFAVRRTADEFYNDMMKHKIMKYEKIKNKIEKEYEEEDQKITPAPGICEGSKKILEKKGDTSTVMPVHERLFTQGKDHMKKQVENIMGDSQQFNNTTNMGAPNDTTQKFVPSIQKKSQAIVRNQNITQILYEDAVRRKDKKDKNVAKSATKEKMDTRLTSENSQKVLHAKFLKELNESYELVDENNRGLLNYIKFGELLKLMGFMSPSSPVSKEAVPVAQDENGVTTEPTSNENEVERILLFDMWQMLKGDDLGGVTLRNSKVFLTAVLDFYFTWMSNPDEPLDSEKSEVQNDKSEIQSPKALDITNLQTKKTVGTFSPEGDLYLRQKEVRGIHLHFVHFYKNRINKRFDEAREKRRKDYTHTFQPNLCRKSEVLATEHKQKMQDLLMKDMENLQLVQPNTKHYDMLIYAGLKYKSKADKEREEKDSKGLEECTFKPNVPVYNPQNTGGPFGFSLSNSITGISVTSPATNRPLKRRDNLWEDLFNEHKDKVDRKDKGSSQIEYERSGKECTFRPSLEKGKSKEGAKSKETTPRGGTIGKGDRDIYDKLKPTKLKEEIMNAKVEIEAPKPKPTQSSLSSQVQAQSKPVGAKASQKVKTPQSIASSEKAFTSQSAQSSQKAPTPKTTQVSHKTQPPQNVKTPKQLPTAPQDVKVQQSINSSSPANQNNNIKIEDDRIEAQPSESRSSRIASKMHESISDKHSETPSVRISDNLADAYFEKESDKESDKDSEKSNNQQEEEDKLEEQVEHNFVDDLEEEKSKSDEEDSDRENQDKDPLLFIDVNMGSGSVERIVIYEGDESDQVAEKFARKHNLDENTKEKLKKLLSSQLQNVLSQIKEEDEEDGFY